MLFTFYHGNQANWLVPAPHAGQGQAAVPTRSSRTGASRCPYAFKPDRGKPLSLRVQTGQGQAAVPTRSSRTGASRCPYVFKPDRGKPLSLRVQTGQGQAAVPTRSNRTGASRCPYAFHRTRVISCSYAFLDCFSLCRLVSQVVPLLLNRGAYKSGITRFNSRQKMHA